MSADEARCVGEMTGVRVRKYKGIEHFDPRLFLEAPLRKAWWFWRLKTVCACCRRLWSQMMSYFWGWKDQESDGDEGLNIVNLHWGDAAWLIEAEWRFLLRCSEAVWEVNWGRGGLASDRISIRRHSFRAWGWFGFPCIYPSIFNKSVIGRHLN